MDKTNYLVLRPSAIEGVGVVAECEFVVGEVIPVWVEDDYKLIVNPLGRELEMCGNYCIPEGDSYHCPKNFNAMSIGWYLNHADEPNATMKDDVCIAIKEIHPGEEVTIDYSVLYY
jgi:SET domain